MRFAAGAQDGSAGAAFAAWEVLRVGNPAVLCGSPLVALLLERWTLPYLASSFPPCMQADNSYRWTLPYLASSFPPCIQADNSYIPS